MSGLVRFLFRQVQQRNFWLLLLATFTMTVMYSFKGALRNELFWDVNNR